MLTAILQPATAAFTVTAFDFIAHIPGLTSVFVSVWFVRLTPTILHPCTRFLWVTIVILLVTVFRVSIFVALPMSSTHIPIAFVCLTLLDFTTIFFIDCRIYITMTAVVFLLIAVTILMMRCFAISLILLLSVAGMRPIMIILAALGPFMAVTLLCRILISLLQKVLHFILRRLPASAHLFY